VPQASFHSPVSPTIQKANPGPWGDLEYYDTYLEAPDPLLDMLSLPSEQIVRNFFGQSRNQILTHFALAGLTQSEMNSISDPHIWRIHGNQCRIYPSADFIETLSPTSRAAIYRILAQWPENPHHRTPMIFDRHDLMEALDRSRLPDELVNQISRLVYQVGGVTLFSDFPLLLRRLTHPKFERRLLRILTRTRTQVLRLRISPDDDLEALADYWTSGNRHYRSLPLLRAVARTIGTERLDVAHFLPALARGQLFTYPSISDVAIDGRAPDCFWTAYNFMRSHPMPVYLDSPGAVDEMCASLEHIEASPSFGDILLISTKDSDRPCHACVYIADDIVFSKPNPSLFTPWIFSQLSDVIALQVRGNGQAKVQAYRFRESVLPAT
jgi:hypothetical protein